MLPESSSRVRWWDGLPFRLHAIPLVLGWAVIVGCVVGGFILLDNVAKSLAFGLCVASPVLILVMIHAVRLSRRKGAQETAYPARRGASFLRGWIASSLILAGLVLIFERLLFFVWCANPLSGALMFGVMTFGLDENMYVAGLFDLWTWHTVLAVPLFMLFLGWVFVPHLIYEGIGPIEAFRRSWRMVTGVRLRLLRTALKTLWMPILLGWVGLYCTVIPLWIPAVRGADLYLWAAGAVLLTTFFGPWFTMSLAEAYVRLKVEDDEEQRVIERQRNTQWFRREPENAASDPRDSV